MQLKCQNKKYHLQALRQYVTQFGENVFSTDGTILFCKVCKVNVTADKRFTVQQYIGREKHLRALENVNKRKLSQLLLKETEVCLFSNFHIFLIEMRMAY